MDLLQIARLIAVIAMVLLVIAGVLFLAARTDLEPGDIVFKQGSFTCAVPLVSSILISLVLTIVINLVLILLKK